MSLEGHRWQPASAGARLSPLYEMRRESRSLWPHTCASADVASGGPRRISGQDPEVSSLCAGFCFLFCSLRFSRPPREVLALRFLELVSMAVVMAEAEVLTAGKVREGWLKAGETGGAVAWSAAAAVSVVMAGAGGLAAGKVGEAWLKVGEMGEAVAWSAAAAMGRS